MPTPNHEDKESLIEPLEGLLIDLDFTLYYTKDLVYGGGSEYVLANQHLKDKFQQALTQATERAAREEQERIKLLIKNNKDKWAQSLLYLVDDFIEKPEEVVKAHLDSILDELTKE